MSTAKNHKHTYSLWYLQPRLGGDYGTFHCDKCRRVFYHSPSTIYYNGAEKYSCCCGYCTNEMIYNDWNERPYA
jgi:hypothetical protein